MNNKKSIGIAFLLLLPGLYLPVGSKAQGTKSSVGQEPAKESRPWLSRYRILVAEYDLDSLAVIRRQSATFTEKFGYSSYIVRCDGKLQLQVGDLRDSTEAQRSLFFCRRNFSMAVIVRASNDRLVEFHSKDGRLRPCTAFDTTALQPDPALFRDQARYWIYPRYGPANTARDAEYLTEDEKKACYYLNLARMMPSLFADVFLPGMAYSSDTNERGLVILLKGMRPSEPLIPDRALCELARCHAEESGKTGYTGHNRQNCGYGYRAECCSYGVSDPLGIIVQLLVDRGVKSLGHRVISLSNDYKTVGIGIRPHTQYKVNAVFDFGVR